MAKLYDSLDMFNYWFAAMSSRNCFLFDLPLPIINPLVVSCGTSFFALALANAVNNQE
jgi:hypothetical protein